MEAQVLYDVREETACISGTDLHNVFRLLFDGEPSPRGAATFQLSRLVDMADGGNEDAQELLFALQQRGGVE